MSAVERPCARILCTSASCFALALVGCSDASPDRDGTGSTSNPSGGAHTAEGSGGAGGKPADMTANPPPGSTAGTSNGGDDGAGDNGSGGEANAQTTGGGTNAGTGGAIDDPDYPPGPYGENNPQVGEVIENLQLQGYRRIGDGTVVSTGTLTQFSLGDLRKADNQYAVILVGAVWCGSCGSAADDFAAAGDALEAEGVTAIELLNHGRSFGSVPSEEEIALWATNHDLTITTAAGVDGRLQQVFQERSYYYIVDLETMDVVAAKQQTYGSPNIGEQAVDAVRALL